MPPDFANAQDEEHLNLLGIFHYVAAGLELAWSLRFPLLYIFLGIVILGAAVHGGGNGQPPPAFMGTCSW